MGLTAEIDCYNWLGLLAFRFSYGARCMTQHCQVRTGTHWVFPQSNRCGRGLTCWVVENLGLGLGKVLPAGES